MTIKNVAASVRSRLLNLAKVQSRAFDEVLQHYAMERILFRLSRSDQADRFVLKGALMLRLWGGLLGRATKDIDLLGVQTCTVDEMVEIVRSYLAIEIGDDGLRFDLDSIAGEEIRLDGAYKGVRVRGRCFLGTARIRFQIDAGFGDVITPEARRITYPTLLDFEAPELLGYTAETAIAEKLHAVVVLDVANTRLKDFFDLWMISRNLELEGSVVSEAIRATFERRQTALPMSTPVGLTAAFHSSDTKRAQWNGYLRKARVSAPMPDLDEVIEAIAALVVPALEALARQEPFDRRWPPCGPWA